jgi:hypothetical protein
MKAKEFSSPTLPLRLSRRLLTSFSDLTFLHTTGQLASASVGNPDPVGKETTRNQTKWILIRNNYFKEGFCFNKFQNMDAACCKFKNKFLAECKVRQLSRFFRIFLQPQLITCRV